MNHSTPGLPVHQQLLEFTQTHVHWVGDAIQPSHPLVVPFSSCPQTLPASESFPMSQLFSWGSQSIRVSALASVFPMNTQDWFPLEWTGWISLQSKGLSRVFSNTTIRKHQFFSVQLSSQSNSHIHRVSDAIQPSHPLVISFSSCPQSLPASESFTMSQLVTWGGQSTGVSCLKCR